MCNVCRPSVVRPISFDPLTCLVQRWFNGEQIIPTDFQIKWIEIRSANFGSIVTKLGVVPQEWISGHMVRGQGQTVDRSI